MAKKIVIGLLQSESKAEAIVNDLRSAGISTNDVSLLCPDKSGARDAASEKDSKAPQGVGTGGVMGGTLGGLAGIGTLAIPGLGKLIAAGPIKAALNGAAAGAASGVAGALIGMGLPEIEARRYAGQIEKGNILLSVQLESSDQISRAKQILESAGAKDVAATGEAGVPAAKPRRPSDPTRNV